ncbi:DUF2459 domain-containing protein [Marinobacter fonticola]|uniref:DUF2459 domain-containing protein n=1 Tax=Marinobacter fonticola TaxID=2603215 RepID=UPI0011E7E377|nr:DUF2459 domain-containing protein [Marinobacter fonticola]
MLKTVVTLLCAGLLAGCGNRLAPPTAPVDPVQIHLMDHGRHPSLILPDGDGWTRYVYGEWRWYAEDDTGLWRGVQALLWPTQAAVGRQSLDTLPRSGRTQAIPEGFLTLYSIEVSTQDVNALRNRLNRYFENPEQRRYQPRYNLYFVKYPERYWMFHQSNQVMARWLQALGVEVHGSGLFSHWQLEE